MRELDLGFGRPTIDHATAHRMSSRAASACSVWATMPAVMRMQPAQPGSLERSRTKMRRWRSASTIAAGAVADAHQHEVGVARPVAEPEPIADGVDAGLRRARPGRDSASRCGLIAERRLERDRRRDVDAVGRQRRGAAARSPPRRRRPRRCAAPASPYALANVRPTTTFGARVELAEEVRVGEVGVGLVEEHAGRAGSARASACTVAARHEQAGRVARAGEEDDAACAA